MISLSHGGIGCLFALGIHLSRVCPALAATGSDDDDKRPSKKQQYFRDKKHRPRIHLDDETFRQILQSPEGAQEPSKGVGAQLVNSDPIGLLGRRFFPTVTLFNLHTREALPVWWDGVLPGLAAPDRTFSQFLRDHYTNQSTEMDDALFPVLIKAAKHFSVRRIEVVSGYRSPKYNLSLIKKGRQVAPTSQHTTGKAVDFRLKGIPTMDLWRFVRSLKLGGVGIYPHSGFVHCDTGRIRFWRGS